MIAASLFFYAWWNPAYLGLILASMFFNFFIGRLLAYGKGAKRNKIILITGIAGNLFALGYFKYANFFIASISSFTGVGWNIEHIVLPLAISFFTFQQITYLVDTYRGQTKEYSFLHYALFVTFFPQLIAGPIVHHSEMMPQFSSSEKKGMDYGLIAVGLSIFCLGLFKKVAIADPLAPYAAETFAVAASGNMLTLFEAWKGVLTYTFQLYFDFSGYSDMAIGLAALFGIRLPLNFNSPYKAYSIIEFWQRWHMTLSRFLKDYLYIPLGGNRKGATRRYINLMITMLLGGLWHGAGWTFIIWGGLHGLYLVINHAWRQARQLYSYLGHSNLSTRILSRSLTFFSVAIAWVFFRADSYSSAIVMIKSLFGYGGIAWPEKEIDKFGSFSNTLMQWGMEFRYLEFFNGFGNVLGMFLMMFIVFVLPNVQQIMGRYPAALQSLDAGRIQWKPNWKWCFFIALAAIISILRLSNPSEFLYFQF